MTDILKDVQEALEVQEDLSARRNDFGEFFLQTKSALTALRTAREQGYVLVKLDEEKMGQWLYEKDAEVDEFGILVEAWDGVSDRMKIAYRNLSREFIEDVFGVIATLEGK